MGGPPDVDFQQSSEPQDGLRSSQQGSLELGLDIFIIEKRFRIEPCETPKFRIQVNVRWPGKGQIVEKLT